jgi:SAM-dependent methyltransferase
MSSDDASPTSTDDLREPLAHSSYPRSGHFDTRWIIDNQMGPHPLWLMEALTQRMPIERGMKVLDLGCGRALTSIFLAKEFGARVWATDLWIPAEENQERIREMEVEDLVTAVHAEAHSLPFDLGSFDAVVSVDAYQYFGTDDLYIGHISSYLREGGQIGIVVPSLFQDFDGTPPATLAPYWEWAYCCFHSPDWWRRHWTKSGRVSVESADTIEEGWRDWLRWSELIEPHTSGWLHDAGLRTKAMLEADRGENLGFARVVATKA